MIIGLLIPIKRVCIVARCVWRQSSSGVLCTPWHFVYVSPHHDVFCILLGALVLLVMILCAAAVMVKTRCTFKVHGAAGRHMCSLPAAVQHCLDILNVVYQVEQLKSVTLEWWKV